MLIRDVEYASIEPWRRQAAREGVRLIEGKTPLRWLVADNDHGTPLGCCGLLVRGQTGIVRGLYVLPAARGQGIGSQLLESAVTCARTQGLTRLEANALAANFFAAHGWRATGQHFKVGADRYTFDLRGPQPINDHVPPQVLQDLLDPSGLEPVVDRRQAEVPLAARVAGHRTGFVADEPVVGVHPPGRREAAGLAIHDQVAGDERLTGVAEILVPQQHTGLEREGVRFHVERGTQALVGHTQAVSDQTASATITNPSQAIRLSVAIMHAPWAADRRAWVSGLVQAVRPHSASVVVDQRHAGVWPTARQAWLQLATQSSTHALLLQDDMRLAPGFGAAIADVVYAHPHGPVCGYTRSYAMQRRVLASGGAWFRAQGVWTKIIVLPRAWIVPFVHWADRSIRPEFIHDDRRLSLFCRVHGIDVWTTVPALGNDLGEGKSLLGHDAVHKFSPLVCDDVAAVDWQAGVDEPPLAPAQWNTDQAWAMAARDPSVDWHQTRLADFPA